jgi:hypothetical protein
MKPYSALNWLVPLIALAGLISSGLGLFWQSGGGPFPFTTLYGDTVQMYGRGMYSGDTLMIGAGFRGTDAITLFIALPLLMISYRQYRRGLRRGAFLLAGALSYFLYNGASLAFAAAYNRLILVYVLLLSASLFAFVLALTSIDLKTLPKAISVDLPNRRIAAFMFLAGGVVLALWGMEIAGSLLSGQPPELMTRYTTTVTHAIDMGIIAPSAILAGVLLWRRVPFGYALAFPLLTLNSLIGLVVIGQTLSQINAGIEFQTGQLAGIVGSWVVLSGLAVWNAVRLYRGIADHRLR